MSATTAKRQTLDPRVKEMRESQLQDAVVELAERTGWFVTFAPDAMKRLAYAAMRSGRGGGGRWPRKGFPDLLMVRPGRTEDERSRLVFAELKSHRGRVEPEQTEWLEAAASVENVEVYIFRPKDWIDGTIEGVLV